MNSEPLRIAVIGAGSIGRRHIDLIAVEPACRLVAIADPDPGATDLAKASNAKYFSGYQALLAQEQLDGVIVAAPNTLHAAIGVACADRGLPFLMEKPVTDTVENGLQLIEAATAAKVRAQVGHHRRFDPAVEEAHRIIHSGKLGNIVAGSGIWFALKHDEYYDVPWRTSGPGGGPLLINLIHEIDMLRYWFGEVESVYAETTSRHRNLPVEDSGAILFRFASGPLITMTFSDSAPSPWGWERNSGDNPHTPAVNENCYRFAGTTAALEFPNLTIWGDASSWLDPLTREARPTRPRKALADQLAHFCNVIQGESPRVTLADGLANLAVVEAVAESSLTKAPVVPRYNKQ